MKSLAPALAAMALVAASAAIASGGQLAPPVSRAKPKATPGPAAPAPATPSVAVPVMAVPPAPSPAGGGEQGFYAALMTAQPGQAGGDPLLDRGLATAMSRMMAAGRCGDAAYLATHSAAPELAARARHICAAK
jgi:hypothetical protein